MFNRQGTGARLGEEFEWAGHERTIFLQFYGPGGLPKWSTISANEVVVAAFGIAVGRTVACFILTALTVDYFVFRLMDINTALL